VPKTEPAGLDDPAVELTDRPDFSGQANLAENDRLRLDRPVLDAGDDRADDRQISGCFGNFQASDDIEISIEIIQAQAQLLFDDSQQHRQAVALDALSHAQRCGIGGDIEQSLQLNQQGPCALETGSDHRAGHRQGAAIEQRFRRIGDAGQAGIAHFKQPQLIRGAKAVLDRAQHPDILVPFTFEIQDGIHHMLEHAWPGDGPILGDMADQDDRDAQVLGQAQQTGGSLADLADTARGRADLLDIQGLDRIDDRQLGPVLFQRRSDSLKIRCREQLHPFRRRAEAVGAQPDLLRRFFARDIERPGFWRQQTQDLQEQGRFADARVTAQQDQRTADKATAQHSVELGQATGQAGLAVRDDLAEIDHGRFADPCRTRCLAVIQPAGAARGLGAGGTSDHPFLDEGVPGATAGTFAQPTTGLMATIGAEKSGFGFGHRDLLCGSSVFSL